MSNVVEYWEDCLRLRIVAQILQLPADCVCSALTLLHRFRRSTTLTPRHLIAACLFSASKLEETHCRTADLLNVSQIVLQDNAPFIWMYPESRTASTWNVERALAGDDYYKEKEILIQTEHRLLRTIGFNVLAPHPHRELLLMCSDFCIPGSITTTAVRLMNDILCFSDLLSAHSAGTLAVAVLYTACVISNEKIDTCVCSKEWLANVDLNVEILERIGHTIIDILMDIEQKLSERVKSF